MCLCSVFQEHQLIDFEVFWSFHQQFLQKRSIIDVWQASGLYLEDEHQGIYILDIAKLIQLLSLRLYHMYELHLHSAITLRPDSSLWLQKAFPVYCSPQICSKLKQSLNDNWFSLKKTKTKTKQKTKKPKKKTTTKVLISLLP